MPTTTPNTPKAQYHPAVDATLVRHFGSALTLAERTLVAAGHPAEIFIELLQANACRVDWAARRLESHIRMVISHLTNAARDIPQGVRVDVATGTVRDIPALAAAYHEALLSLEAVAEATAMFQTAPTAPRISAAEAPS